MQQANDLTGKRFGRLNVIKRNGTKSNFAAWLCKCDCGNTTVVIGRNLITGNTKSCGCLHLENVRKQGNPERIRTHMEEVEMKDGTQLCNLTMKLPCTNSSGVKGVYFNKEKRLWQAFIKFQGKAKYLGRYATIEEATKARKLAEDEYFEPVLNKYGRTLYKED